MNTEKRFANDKAVYDFVLAHLERQGERSMKANNAPIAKPAVQVAPSDV